MKFLVFVIILILNQNLNYVILGKSRTDAIKMLRTSRFLMKSTHKARICSETFLEIRLALRWQKIYCSLPPKPNKFDNILLFMSLTMSLRAVWFHFWNIPNLFNHTFVLMLFRANICKSSWHYKFTWSDFTDWQDKYFRFRLLYHFCVINNGLKLLGLWLYCYQ